MRPRLGSGVGLALNLWCLCLHSLSVCVPLRRNVRVPSIITLEHSEYLHHYLAKYLGMRTNTGDGIHVLQSTSIIFAQNGKRAVSQVDCLRF